jgi:hypothetical protein
MQLFEKQKINLRKECSSLISLLTPLESSSKELKYLFITDIILKIIFILFKFRTISHALP